MPVDKTELAKDLESPEYQELVKETLGKKDFIVRSKADETGFLDRFKADVIEKEMPARVKSIHDQYDKDTKELFGIDRNQDEKSYEYLKRAAKAKLGELDTLQGKIAGLEEQIKKGDPSGALTKKLEDAEKIYQAELKKWQDKANELEQRSTLTERKALVSTVYAGIKKDFKAALPPLFDRVERTLLQEAETLAVIKDGKLYLGDGNGGIKKDAQFNEITLEDYLKGELKDVIEVRRNQPGAGSGNPAGAPDPSTITAENFERPVSVKTKQDLTEAMLKAGLKRGTKVYDDIWKKHAAGLPLG
jgi:hypothetical protein